VQRWANRGIVAGAAAFIVLRFARHLVSRAAEQRRRQRGAACCSASTRWRS